MQDWRRQRRHREGSINQVKLKDSGVEVSIAWGFAGGASQNYPPAAAAREEAHNPSLVMKLGMTRVGISLHAGRVYCLGFSRSLRKSQYNGLFLLG
ncbi:unnamed protein product [Brassica oleracea var. botrytis]